MSGAAETGRTAQDRVVVIGDALIDEMIDETGSVDAPGGSALNVAVGVSTLGLPATLVAMIAEDGPGAWLSAHLAAHDVELIASPSALGTGRAISDRTAGEPRYRFSEASVNRTIAFTPGTVAAIRSGAMVAISGFPFDDEAQSTALAAATAPVGERLVIDPNPRAGLLRDGDAFRRGLERIASSCLMVKIGEEDAALLYGEGLDTVASRFVALGARTVLATAGADGARIYSAGFEVARPIRSLPEPIVDTMGAGDATFASVIAQLVRLSGPPTAEQWSTVIDRAMAIAAATVRRPGGILRMPLGQV